MVVYGRGPSVWQCMAGGLVCMAVYGRGPSVWQCMAGGQVYGSVWQGA